MYVGVSPFLSVLFFGVIQIIFCSSFSLVVVYTTCVVNTTPLFFRSSFDCRTEISSNPFSSLPCQPFTCLRRLVEYPPKVRQRSLCIAHGYMLTTYFCGLIFFRFRPHCGKESSLFVPSFLLFLCRIPTAACRPLSATI